MVIMYEIQSINNVTKQCTGIDSVDHFTRFVQQKHAAASFFKMNGCNTVFYRDVSFHERGEMICEPDKLSINGRERVVVVPGIEIIPCYFFSCTVPYNAVGEFIARIVQNPIGIERLHKRYKFA